MTFRNLPTLGSLAPDHCLDQPPDRPHPLPSSLGPIIFFRTPTPDSAGDDPYELLATTSGHVSATSVQILQDRLMVDQLVPLIKRGASDWEAVIITSRRAAESWVRAARLVCGGSEVMNGDRCLGGVESRVMDEAVEPWQALQVYSPGPAVSTVLSTSALPPHMIPTTTRTAKNAAGLAPIIIDEPPRYGAQTCALAHLRNSSSTSEGSHALSPSRHKPYLMLVGDKTLPTLPTALAEAGRTLVKVPVYATEAVPGLDAVVARIVLPFLRGNGRTNGQLEDVPSSLPPEYAGDVGDARDGGDAVDEHSRSRNGHPLVHPNTPTHKDAWCVLFSPSSAEAILPLLERHGVLRRDGDSSGPYEDLGPTQPANAIQPRHIRLAAIGDTTAAALRRNGWRVDVVAQTPDAPGVMQAIAEFVLDARQE